MRKPLTNSPSPTESQEQQALVKWWRLQYPLYGMLLFHIPNGGWRDFRTAKRLKSEGVVAGVADLFLAIPKGKFHGLFIEMKREGGGRQSKTQKEFEKAVRERGYGYALCHGWQEAASAIRLYLYLEAV